MYDRDSVLGECDWEPVEEGVSRLEPHHPVAMVKRPSAGLRAGDSLEKQEFPLGEALTPECEVTVNGRPGFGVCLGEEPVRGYCLAGIDALLEQAPHGDPEIEAFLERHSQTLRKREQHEFNLILRSQVDYKLMEQE